MSDHSHLGDLESKSIPELQEQLRAILGAQRLARAAKQMRPLVRLKVDQELVTQVLAVKLEQCFGPLGAEPGEGSTPTAG